MPRTKGSTNKPKAPINPVVADPVPNPNIVGSKTIIISEPTKSKQKNIYICERCKTETEQYLNVIDTNILTLVADYHRESPKLFRLCRKCCNELSECVDKWYLEKGKGKFE